MIHINYRGIKNVASSITLFNINFQKRTDQKIKQNLNGDTVKKKFKDYKTALEGTDIELIKDFKEDITLYLFIEEQKKLSSWNMVVPVVVGNKTGITYQYKKGCFALEGCGGGFSNTDLLISRLSHIMSQGFEASIIPRVVQNNLLKDFQFFDSSVTLEILIANSTDLILHRKNEFEYIYSNYRELTKNLKIR